MKLGEISSLIRSKNAGPFVLTFDILFDDDLMFEQVKNSGVLTKELISKLYRCPAQVVKLFICDNMKAIKFSIPRPITQGDIRDSDMLGGQQFAPLLSIEIPG